MDEVLNLFWQFREKPGFSVTLVQWNDVDGQDGFILSLLPSPGGGKRRCRGQRDNPPKYNMGPKDAKTLINAKSFTNAKRFIHAKWAKDAIRVAYTRR